ncbi:MAG: dihydropteroate synthase [Candidatus Omnitrophota bacterium]
MQEIGVDPYGIKIMAPKAVHLAIRLNTISNINANIIKQEMLSLGADAAVTRGSLTGKTKTTDILLLGQLLQLKALALKLKLQPFGLKKLGEELIESIKNYSNDNFILPLGKHSLNLGQRTHIMGIINLTPDSFSNDGLYKNNSKQHLALALAKAQKMVAQGADIIDLGGESSRPGAKEVSIKEELLRTIPVIKLLAKKIKVPISIDTNKPEVAHAALATGASLVNDICGLRDRRMIKVVAKHNAGVVIMHMQNRPSNMQKNIRYHSVVDEITTYLKNAIDTAQDGGINPNKIIIDPGIGFGKTITHNYEIIKHLSDFKILGKPILIGVSRKSFIKNTLKSEETLSGSLAAAVGAASRGANIIRVHDIQATRAALKITNSINNAHD